MQPAPISTCVAMQLPQENLLVIPGFRVGFKQTLPFLSGKIQLSESTALQAGVFNKKGIN